jgi:hypothetical protein
VKTLITFALGAAAGAAACLAVLAMPVPASPGGEPGTSEDAEYERLFGAGAR